MASAHGKGKWNVSTNLPALSDSIGLVGDFYVITTNGQASVQRDLGSGTKLFLKGETIVKTIAGVYDPYPVQYIASVDEIVGHDGTGGGMINPMSALGDMIYGDVDGSPLSLSIGTANQVLTVVGGIPHWETPLSTSGVTSVSGTAHRVTVSAGLTPVVDIADDYVGQTSLTTLGIVTVGTWNGNTILADHGGTGQTGYTIGDILYANATNSLAKLGIGSSGKVLTVLGGIPSWQTPAVSGGTVTSVDIIPGTGISAIGGPITTSGSFTVTNTLPDLTVVISGSTGILVTGTYPTFNITNTLPDLVVSLTSGIGIVITGTYPNFTITNTSPSTGGTVTSVSGTADRVFVTSGTTTPVIDIASTYAGQDSIVHVGILTSGTWHSTPIDLATYVTGNLDISHLNSGIAASSSAFWRGDGSWGTPAGTIYTGTLPINVTGTVISIALATSGTSGYLSATDWLRFTTKQAALLGTGIVYDTAGTISYIAGTSGQFVKGDGTLDSNVYIASGSTAGGDLIGTYPNPTIKSNVGLSGNPTTTTQVSTDSSTKIATTAYVTTAINNAISAINPAVAVQAATTLSSDTSSLVYNNGVSGIGATLIGAVNTALVFDGYTITGLNQRVLVKNDTQSPSGAFNGVYFLSQLQTVLLAPILTRALDYDQPSDINNTGAIPVINGTMNADTSWLLTSLVSTMGTDPLTYIRFSVNPASLVPYVGATTDVNIGTHSISGTTSSFATSNVNNPTSTTGVLNVNGQFLLIMNAIAPISLTNAIVDTEASVNSYLQHNVRNASAGNGASGDFVVTADNGTDSTNYIDVGINSSGFSQAGWTINGAADGYIYTQSTNIAIGTASNKSLVFFTGGTLLANQRHSIDGSGNQTFTLGSDATGDIWYRNGSGYFTRLPIGAANRSLLTSGSVIGWGQVSLTSGVTGVLPVANGGRGVRIGTESTSGITAINTDLYDQWNETALAAADTFGVTGSPSDGQTLILRIKDNGTARGLTFTTGAGQFRFSTDLVAPSTTVINKTLYLGFRYNATDNRWDCLAQLNNI